MSSILKKTATFSTDGMAVVIENAGTQRDDSVNIKLLDTRNDCPLDDPEGLWLSPKVAQAMGLLLQAIAEDD